MKKISKKNEKLLWDFAKESNWAEKRDFHSANKLFSSKTKEEREALSKTFYILLDNLGERFRINVFGLLGDDGWSDLRSCIIGRGETFFKEMTGEKIRIMAMDRDYTESFAYSFIDWES